MILTSLDVDAESVGGARMGNKGKREFIQMLRLFETMPLSDITDAVTEAVQLGAHGFDAMMFIAWR